MCETSLSVWFVCRLCRGSFGQVDAFIEHKKQKHFTEFQNTTSIVFEERELGPLFPVVNSRNHQLVDEINEPTIKTEFYQEDPMSSEIINESNLDLVEPKNEPIIFECELNSDNENNFFSLKQPHQNPYVLLKRLTSEEIHSAGVPQHDSALLKCEQKHCASLAKPPNSLSAFSNISDHNEAEILPTAPGTVNRDLQFECKLCSKNLESDAQLKIHMGICALYHEDRNRFCVMCNRKFFDTKKLKEHRLRFHGTEEEKLSLYKFKCHLCPKQYRKAVDLSFHLESHKKKKQKVKTSESMPVKCSYPNCGTKFRWNAELQRHIAAVHLGVRPFSCHFPNCNKTFTQRCNLNVHLRTHTGERPYKCTVDNCSAAFTTSQTRFTHHRSVHCNL